MLCWLGLWWGAERIDAAEIDASQRRLREIETRISQNPKRLRVRSAGKNPCAKLEALGGGSIWRNASAGSGRASSMVKT